MVNKIKYNKHFLKVTVFMTAVFCKEHVKNKNQSW